MAEKIYIRNSSGELEALKEKPFPSEAMMQELVGRHPELLAGDQIRPDDPLRWVLIKREMEIDGWAVDHLLLDQHARLTLVEVKRGSNRQVRREIVGQMLDYAATAAAAWSDGNVRRVFEKSQDEPDEVISKLLKGDAEPDIEAFWERVATNLEANRLRLLFVADEIPAELERVVKFLNEQTGDTLEILAVEVKQYPGQFGQAIVSSVKGQTTIAKSGTGKTGGTPYCLCGCGGENNPKRRFQPGHDGRLKGWLGKIEKDDFQIEGDLSYAAEMCRNDAELRCGKYTSAAIISIAEKLEAHKQQH